MTFSGDLTGIHLADVFQNIHGNRLTGTMQVSTREGDRYVYFQQGLITGYSRGINKGLPMGNHLAQRGYVERTLLATAIKNKGKTTTLLSEVLAEMDVLSREEFAAVMCELIEESLFDLLRLEEASFEFTEGAPLPRVFDTEQKAARIAIDPSGILMETARRHDEWERIDRVVLSERDVFVVLEGWEECGLGELALSVGQCLDGATDVASILEELPYSRFDVLKAITDLVMLGHARPLSDGEIEGVADETLTDEPRANETMTNEDPEEAGTVARPLPAGQEDVREAPLHRSKDSTPSPRLEDMASGEHAPRRARRRGLAVWAAVLATLLGLLAAGIVEIAASYQMMRALENSLEDITQGKPSAAMRQLNTVWARFRWTGAGRSAGRLVDRLLEFEIQQLEKLLAAGDHAAVLERLTWLRDKVSRADVRQRLDALVQRTRLEQEASPLFRQANQSSPDPEAIKAVAGLTDPGHLDFILSRLSDPATLAPARRALLTALEKIDNPRSFPAVARLYVAGGDSTTERLARSILMTASRHREQGRESSWSSVYQELEAADSSRASQVLLWLRGR